MYIYLILCHFVVCLFDMAAAAASENGTNDAHTNALWNDYSEYVSSNKRHLQAEDIGRAMASLFDTPIDAWTGAQWLCLVVLLIAVSILFRCLCGGCCRRSYPRTPYYGPGGYYGGGYPQQGGGYYGNNSRGSCCGLSDVFWCLCCFEWCCRDCQDCDALRNAAGNAYQGGEMV